MLAKSNTAREAPKWDIAKIETAAPSRMQLLNASAEPNRTRPRIETVDERRVKARNDMLLPKHVKSNTAKAAATRDTPKRENDDPKRANERSDSELPKDA
jgi:hypothetical protein